MKSHPIAGLTPGQRTWRHIKGGIPILLLIALACWASWWWLILLPLLIDRITGNIKLITFIRNEAERLITAHTEELTASLEALEDGEPVNEPCDPHAYMRAEKLAKLAKDAYNTETDLNLELVAINVSGINLTTLNTDSTDVKTAQRLYETSKEAASDIATRWLQHQLLLNSKNVAR